MSVAEVAARLETSPEAGLSSEEAARRLAAHGPNELEAAAVLAPWQILLAQFKNVLILILLVAVGLSAVLGHATEAVVISVIIVFAAVLGFVQEYRAERAIEALRRMAAPNASVVRDGKDNDVPARELVPGDVVLLRAGDRASADARLSEVVALQVEEAALTGESQPVEKQIGGLGDEEVQLGDRMNIVFAGTTVTYGKGRGIVVATGMETEFGGIARMLQTIERGKTPLQLSLDRVGMLLARAALVLVIVVVGIGVLRGEAFLDMLLFGAALAVAVVPEALPAVITISLTLAAQRMVRRQVLVRSLPAIETLGSVSVICSDKTGTLTRNEMTVRTLITAGGEQEVSGTGYAPAGMVSGPPIDPDLARAAALCNDAELRQTEAGWVVDGDPMEGALLALASKAGQPPDVIRAAEPRIDEIPFDARHRFMATVNGHGDRTIFIKGAPEEVLDLCALERRLDADHPIDRQRWLDGAEGLAARGQRLLALATRSAPPDDRPIDPADLAGATLLGLAGFIDPPREEAVEAVAQCRDAGIRVMMITGDHAATAGEIARQLQLADSPRVLTGRSLDALDEEELRRHLAVTDVFARTTPEHKLRLVEALQARGATVAMTGDGVNDAPALKRADVGVAMGRKGTEVSKEAAQIVLADDNFASIAAAVAEGRTVYDNLRKVIGWTLPTNGGESLTILAAIAFGLTLPVTPLQILWINMVTAVALGLALAFEPAETDIMTRPPRPRSENLLSRTLVRRVALVSLLMALGAFGTFAWGERRGLSLDASRTLVVNAIVVMEIFYLFSIRYIHGTSLTLRGLTGTPAVLVGVGVVILAQLAFTYAGPMQGIFGTAAVSVADGAFVLLVGVALLLLVEIEKLIGRPAGIRAGRRGHPS